MTENSSTIYAISSGSGRAGVAVLRLSGTRVRDVLDAVAGGVLEARRAVLRSLRDPADQTILDQALVLFFPAPHSVTGEDVAEFHLHGSPSVVSSVLRVLSHQPGLAMAEAGDFTRRAFVNGKMDLIEVEGLSDLLAASSESQRRLAMRQLTGANSMTFDRWRDDLVSALAMIEAAVDFIEEEGVAAEAVAQVIPRVVALMGQLEAALAMADRASAIRDGVKVVIAGPPNAGKSSLINWLSKRDVAIVSPIAGTTRDVVEASVSLGGIPVVLSDTAGLRGHTEDEIEKIGMARAEREIGLADLLVWVTAVDGSEQPPPLTPPHNGSQKGEGKAPDLIVVNKIDLGKIDRGNANSIHNRNESFISLKTGDGLDFFMARLIGLLADYQQVGEAALVVRTRHVEAVTRALEELNLVLDSREAPLEITAEHLRRAAHHLASLTGKVGVEDLLGRIFSEFCIGK